jgi:transposase
MDFHHYVGIDIAKATLDWAVYSEQGTQLYFQTPNSVAGVKIGLRNLKALTNWQPTRAVFCMEHTGIYNAHLLEYLDKLHLPIWLESSLQIKQAGGMQRGKTDKVDAQRIAEYAYRFRDRTRLWQPPRPIIRQLAFLSAARQRVIQVYNQLAGPLDEQDTFVSSTMQKQVRHSCKASLVALGKDRKALDKQIENLIRQDEHLHELFTLITSVPGIGPATATEILVATNELKTVDSPKKMACHAGVAPFEYRSGSSVRGKTRVSHQAQKRLKSLFHLGAMSAIQVNGEIQKYYQRKVAEGKNKMLVLNAVRNKLIHRVYAVVRRGEKYDKFYSLSLA